MVFLSHIPNLFCGETYISHVFWHAFRRAFWRAARAFLHFGHFEKCTFCCVTSDNKKKSRGLGARTPRLLISRVYNPSGVTKNFFSPCAPFSWFGVNFTFFDIGIFLSFFQKFLSVFFSVFFQFFFIFLSVFFSVFFQLFSKIWKIPCFLKISRKSKGITLENNWNNSKHKNLRIAESGTYSCKNLVDLKFQIWTTKFV